MQTQDNRGPKQPKKKIKNSFKNVKNLVSIGADQKQIGYDSLQKNRPVPAFFSQRFYEPL